MGACAKGKEGGNERSWEEIEEYKGGLRKNEVCQSVKKGGKPCFTKGRKRGLESSQKGGVF